MKKTKLISVLIVCLSLWGCVTTGLSPRTSSVDYGRFVYDIASADTPESATPTGDKNIPLRLPLRVAVAQLGENAPPMELVTGLESAPELIEQVISLPLPPIDGPARPGDTGSAERARRLRQLAGQLGANYVFIVGGSIESRTESNAAEVFDILLLPIAFVPSHRVLVHSKAVGTLLAVEDGRPVSVLHVEAQASDYAATARVDQRYEALASAQRTELSHRMAARLLEELRARAPSAAAL